MGDCMTLLRLMKDLKVSRPIWTPHCCSITGISCSDSHIISISWTFSQIDGFIPEYIDKFVKLQGLFLFGNQIIGQIPAEIGNLKDLKFLELGDNLLSGAIPESIGNLTKLESLDLESNNLSGSFPCSVSKLNNLRFLLIDDNKSLGGVLSEGTVQGIEVTNTNITICSNTDNSDKCVNSCVIKPTTFMKSESQSSGMSLFGGSFSLILPLFLI